jgi:ubiquinone/menaquinone biosynthesis C-methylase UbiE
MNIKDLEEQEILQGRMIANNAEVIWNWTSYSGRKRAERRADLIVKYGDLKSWDSVLEIGCGTGIFTELLCIKTNPNLIAVDISEDLINVALKRRINATFEIQNAHGLNFDNNSFDKVVGSSVLHHLNLDIALNEIYRVLKPGGRMIFAEPNIINPQIFLQKKIQFIKEISKDTKNETAINRFKFIAKLKEAGFKNCKLIPHEFLHPLIPRQLARFVIIAGDFLERIPLVKEIGGSILIVADKEE